ncbi:FtsH protease activity modulator HflK [Lutispora sp.]|uniref:FtsH protease activity modulator HflK n=1 Tax=Lutispora sp. TaxID=2828727 RepID=UPI002B212AD9|nr:FtsH protease activity modulator HflK [Lutispora sp.]MEA4963531.1 FtsH protease activity modulator HflK [Lutispora sp.]
MIKFSEIYKMFSYTKLLAILLIIMITFFIFSSIYTVKEGEVGVLRTFGRVTDFTKPGLHLKFPYPVQDIDVMNVSRSNLIEVGFKDAQNAKRNSQNHESQLVTGDDGIILVDLLVEWRISDPYAYLFKVKDPESILKNSILSSLQSAASKSTVDSILSDGKTILQNDIKKDIEKNISGYNLGIELLSVKILDAKPAEEIKPAFDAVFDAIEQKNILINKAEEYRNQKVPAAEGEANKMIKEAEAYKEERINKAKAETDSFNSIYKEYKMSKEVTKSRMLIEALEEILPGANIYIMDTKNGTLNNIPTEEIKGEK